MVPNNRIELGSPVVAITAIDRSVKGFPVASYQRLKSKVLVIAQSAIYSPGLRLITNLWDVYGIFGGESYGQNRIRNLFNIDLYRSPCKVTFLGTLSTLSAQQSNTSCGCCSANNQAILPCLYLYRLIFWFTQKHEGSWRGVKITHNRCLWVMVIRLRISMILFQPPTTTWEWENSNRFM